MAEGQSKDASSRERKVTQAPRFGRMKRRLVAEVQKAVDDTVTSIMKNPMLGDPKKGALKGVRVEKFKAANQQWLLAFQFNEKDNMIELLDIGSHENFYRDLEAYLKDR